MERQVTIDLAEVHLASWQEGSGMMGGERKIEKKNYKTQE